MGLRVYRGAQRDMFIIVEDSDINLKLNNVYRFNVYIYNG